MVFFLLIPNIVHAEKPDKPDGLYPGIRLKADDSDHSFHIKSSDCNAYLSVDDKWTAMGQEGSEEMAIKDPGKTSPYFEVGVSKKY